VLPAYAMWDADVHWLAPQRAQTPKRVRLLIDFLAERFRGEPWQVVKASASKPLARRGSRPAP
jgi:LysR family transcriptional regulator, transcriptional activator for dmlA